MYDFIRWDRKVLQLACFNTMVCFMVTKTD